MDLKVGNLNLERLKFQNLYNTYLGLTPREQTISLIGAAVVILLVIFLPVSVASNRISNLEKSIEQANSRLKDITFEISQLNESKSKLAQEEAKLAGGFDASISTTLENLASKSGISERIDSLKEKAVSPSDLFDEASVDVRLKKVTLPELIDYLYAIEHNTDKLLRLKRLEIKPRYDNPKEFNVSFQVSTYRML